MSTRVVRDAVHGLIDLQVVPDVLDLINTREMQRLRRISQLGVSSLTYPGATHTRFAHSLGVYWVFHRICEHLGHLGAATALDEPQERVGAYAALLHDLGHLPFSHALERSLGSMNHEARTCALIEDSGTEVNRILSAVGSDWPRQVADVIRGTSDMRRVVGLVSSQLDADRMDYLLRDSLCAGVDYGHYDLDRLIYSMVGFDEDNIVVLSRKSVPLAEQYVLARYHMYWQVYFHKTTRCAELLLINALHLARRAGALPPALAQLVEDDSVETFMRIDESDIMQALKSWADRRDDLGLSRLASAVLHRTLFKCACTAGMWGEMDQRDFDRLVRSGNLEAAVSAKGYDPEFFLIVDRPTDQAYDPYYISPRHEEAGKPPIVIEDQVKRSVTLETISEVVGQLSRRQVRGAIYVPEECLAEVHGLFRS